MFSKKVLFLALVLGLFTYSSLAQKWPNFAPLVTAETPNWAKLMYADQPNVWEVETAFKNYYREHSFEKNIHTQFYKKWRRVVEPFVQADGRLKFPPEAERIAAQKKYENQIARQAETQKLLMPAWKALGPFETYSTGNDQEKVSWQTNVYTIDVFAGNTDILYCGTEAGGLFTTTDKGENWEAASYSAPFKTVRVVKIHPDDPHHVLVGARNEIYRTMDGGNTWEVIFSSNNFQPNAMVFLPSNPRIQLVAGNGGVYRSTDNGNNWQRVGPALGAHDMVLSEGSGSRIFLLMRGAERAEMYVSDDNGDSFALKDTGWYMPSTAEANDAGGRIAVSAADSNRVYVVLIGQDKGGDNGFIGVYRSDDFGENWQLPNGPPGGPYSYPNPNHPNLATINPDGSGFHQGFYNLAIEASDSNPDELLIGHLNLWRSADGAATFEAVGGYRGVVSWIHPDQQDMIIVGDDMWLANDGGINLSHDMFASHTSKIKGINGADFWGFGSAWNEDLLVGGRYHNGNTAFRPSFPAGQSLRLGGGEAPTGYVNPGGNNEVYFSDIGSKIIPYDISGDVINFARLARYPNESYFAAHSSEMEFDPRYHNHIYIGQNNALWKSVDKGQSFTLLHAFGDDEDSPVFHFDISRANPDVIYVYQRKSFYGAVLWRSEDGGTTWEELDFPDASSQRAGTMSLDPEDENHLLVAFAHQNNDGNKIFETRDGGRSWTNLTTSTLDGHRIHAIHYQGGSDGAIYLAGDKTVFYKDNKLQDWALYNENLPFVLNGNILRPFYKEDKLRLASYGNGIWEVAFMEPSRPVAQPMVDKKSSTCTRDTFYFDDFSILNHTNARWQWTFDPQPKWVESDTIRNPRVVFGGEGFYTVTLTVSNDQGSSTRTIEEMVEVSGNDCQPEKEPGLVLDFNGTDASVQFSAINRETNTFTFSAWIKRRAAQNDWGGILFSRAGNTVAGLSVRTNGDLGYHWNNSGWAWSSGLNVPVGEWAYVGMRVSPDSVTLFLNEEQASHVTTVAPEEWDGPWHLGVDPNGGSRYFNGEIEEVAIWERAVSMDTIQLLRHLIKDADMVAAPDHYYQFNATSNQVLDRIGLSHGLVSNSVLRNTSSAPIGVGKSTMVVVTGGGKYLLDTPDYEMDLGAGTGNGKLVASRLETLPYLVPAGDLLAEGFTIFNWYGDNPLSRLDAVLFLKIDTVLNGEVGVEGLFSIQHRPANADTDSWQGLENYQNAKAGKPGALSFGPFEDMETTGQYVIQKNFTVGTEEKNTFQASYQAVKNQVMLSWFLSNPGQWAGFEIEKKLEGGDFKNIGRVKVNAGQSNYLALDTAPGSGRLVYRLKMILPGGGVQYTEEATVYVKFSPFAFKVYPNPVQHAGSVTIEQESDQYYQFFLLSAEGKMLEHFVLQGKDASIFLEQAPGIYFYKIVAGDKMYNGKLIIR